MIWTLILRFTIADIRSALFIFPRLSKANIAFRKVKKVCQQRRAFCSGVNARLRLTTMSMCKIFHTAGQMGSLCAYSVCWVEGCRLTGRRCALIHCHRPDLLDYDKLNKQDRHGNTELAFQIAADHLGIPVCLTLLCFSPPTECTLSASSKSKIFATPTGRTNAV